jgi:hypothetical protein
VRRILAAALIAVLVTLAALHVYWAAGGRAGAQVAVPRVAHAGDAARPLFVPSPWGTLAVALGACPSFLCGEQMNSPAFAVFVAVAAILQAPPQAAAISTAKKAIVRELDNTLAAVAFETWLRGLVGSQAEMKWEVNDCGEQTGTAADRGRDLPLCAEVQLDIPGRRRLSLSLLVGSENRGVTGGLSRSTKAISLAPRAPR